MIAELLIAEPITEEWLKSAGFKWHQLDRQPEKHWVLWLGDALDERMTSFEDLGVEVCAGAMDDAWFCWLRADTAGRYHRFLHVRHLRYCHELVRLIEGLTGLDFNPANCFYGGLRTDRHADYLRREHERLDQQMLRQGHPWHEVERDDTRGRALPEHLEARELARGSFHKLP